MGLFTHAKPKTEWTDAGVPPIDLGDISLRADGTFCVGPFPFDQDSELRQVRLSDASLMKRAGLGEVLSISLEDGRGMFLKYDGTKRLVLRRVA